MVTPTMPAATIAERVEVCQKHLAFSIRWKGERVGLFEMRPHYTNYFRGIANFKPYRMKLVTADSWQEVSDMLEEVAMSFSSYYVDNQGFMIEYEYNCVAV